MGKKRNLRKIDPKVEKDRKKAKARREALWTYAFITIVIGLILYGLYLQTLHHP